MGRSRKDKAKQVDGDFVRFPKLLYQSDAYLNLSTVSQQVLMFVCTQYNGRNNGDLTCTPKAMREKYRMKIADKTVYRCIGELLDSGVMLRTVQGGKHKASRFAISIFSIDSGGDLEKETATPPAHRFLRKVAPQIKSTAFLMTAKDVNSFPDDSLGASMSP